MIIMREYIFFYLCLMSTVCVCEERKLTIQLYNITDAVLALMENYYL